MALQPSTHAHVHASTHASHASHGHAAHAAHAASKAKPTLTAEEGEGGGFAAQLLKAQPAPAKDAKAVDAKPKADAAKKPTDAKDDHGADAKAAPDGKDDKDAQAAAAQAVPLDAAALLAQQQQQAQAPIAPPTTSLADKGAATDDHDDFAADPLGALRKAASAKAGQDDGKQALLASLGAGKQPAADATAAGLPGKGAASTGDIAAALAKAEGAVKAATEARDSLAAMLPQPDPMAVQAGAVGASANALQTPDQGVHQAPQAPMAQATLPMTPQSPTFAPALGQQIDVWMKGGVQHAEVQLSPQDLGPIRVKIEMEGAHTRVQMSADVPSTREALQQAMPQLSEQLGQVGISLTGGGVSDQPAFQQSQARANDTDGRQGGMGGSGRPGAGGAPDGGEDIAMASAARQQAQRRGLLDLYA